nr:HIRAN domain-containing protein [Enterococcus lemanii]
MNFYLRGWRHYQLDSAAKIDSDDALILQLDLDNPYDKNAVRVLKNEETIGYIPSFYSKFVRTILEENLLFDLKYRYHENAPSHYKVKLSLSGVASPTLVDQLKMSKMVKTDTQS